MRSNDWLPPPRGPRPGPPRVRDELLPPGGHMSTTLTFPTGAPPATLPVRPWPDGVIDALGHDPRSVYVERFWLGILGPSTTWLLRRLAAGLEAEPAGFSLSLPDTAQALGLGG